MKKVCIVRHGYFPGDIRVRKESLALINKGYHVDVICLKKAIEKNIDIFKGVNVYRLPVTHNRGGILRYFCEYASFFCLATIKLCLLFFRNRYDFIQVNTLPDFLVFVAVIPKIFGAKVILDLHEPAPELYREIFGEEKKFLTRIITFIEQISIRFADKVITVSDQMKNNYVQRGALSSKISVILNVANLAFNPELYSKETQNNKQSEILLITHGTVIKRYGQYIVIKAMRYLKDHNPSFHLNILGSGEYVPELKKIISNLQLDDHVTLKGVLPFADMIKMIAISDVGIVPVEKNSYSDLVHTNKMFEYIAMRKPVVITRMKAVEAFFGSGDECLKYFESGDEKDLARGILEICSNPEKRNEMTKNAFDKYKPFRWEITQEDYIRLFS